MAGSKTETNCTFVKQKKVQTNNIAKILSRGPNKHEFMITIEAGDDDHVIHKQQRGQQQKALRV